MGIRHQTPPLQPLVQVTHANAIDLKGSFAIHFASPSPLSLMKAVYGLPPLNRISRMESTENILAHF